MDTIVSLTFAPGTDTTVSETAVATLNDLSEMLDCHNANGLTGRLNAHGTVHCPDERFPSLITQTLALEARFGTAVQLTCRPLTALWGINHSDSPPETCPDTQAIANALAYVDDSQLTVDGQTISLARGAALDCGAIGKGYAMDELATEFAQTELPYAVISAVSSVLLYGQKPSGEPFSVQVTNPLTDGVLGTVTLQNDHAHDATHVGTSGGGERFLTIAGKRYCHLLDLTTGYPSTSDLAAVSVFTDSGLKADYLSTLIYLGGTDGLTMHLSAADYLVLAVTQDGTVIHSDALSFSSNEGNS